MTETNDKSLEAEQRDRWIRLLRAGYMFHQQEVKDTMNPRYVNRVDILESPGVKHTSLIKHRY